MRIFVTGDVHGNLDYRKLQIFRDKMGGNVTVNDYLIICGDFGIIWDDGEKDAYFKNRAYRYFPCTILWVDGNHENFDALYKYPVETWNGGKVHRITPRILHLMRGEIFSLGDGDKKCKIFAFGGAKSVDRGYDTGRNLAWWKEELPSFEEIENAKANLKDHDNKVDYIITHDICITKFREMFQFEKEITSHLNYFLEEVALTVKFKDWYFGHYHENTSSGKFHCLYNNITEIIL